MSLALGSCKKCGGNQELDCGLNNFWVTSVDLGVVVTAAVSVRVPPSQLPPPAANQQPPADPLPSPPDHAKHGNLTIIPRAN
ncbi:hypothetical protein DFQ26_003116 [Actinomortierella ambigua]|nr:hypothetical protein DFQ26_003116 [Actinomortierella ambigua]